MHKVQPNQEVRIIAVEIAVPADAEEGEIADQISAYLTENGTALPESAVLDWSYLYPIEMGRIVKASEDPYEGEIFEE